MTHSWVDVFPELDGEPITGRPGDYHAAAALAERESARMTLAAAEGHTLLDAEAWGGVQGATGVALRSSADDLHRLVAGVAPAFDACRAVLDAHAEALTALRADADAALDVALDRQSTLRSARREHAERCAELDTVEAELRWLAWAAGDPLTLGRIHAGERRRAGLHAQVSAAVGQVDRAEADVAASRAEHAALAARERELIEATVTGLIGVPVFDAGTLLDAVDGLTAAIGVVASGVLGTLDAAGLATSGVGEAVGDVVGAVLGGLFGDEFGDGAELVVDALTGTAERRAATETAAAAERLLDQVGDALLGLLWCASRLSGGPPASGDLGGTFTVESRGALMPAAAEPTPAVNASTAGRQAATGWADRSVGVAGDGALAGMAAPTRGAAHVATDGLERVAGGADVVGAAAGEGAALVAAALAATADSTRLAADEFGLVAVGPNRFVVVLPGVTDLTRPQPGLDPRNRTPRDTDVNAWPSFPTTGAVDNGYARLVAAGLAAADVPPGAELAIVGHSFGADTALDLAADPAFNGSGGYRVTHVAAAGYDSAAQLPHVPLETEVLVLQNTHDVPVLVEHAARPAATALDLIDDGLEQLRRGDISAGRAQVDAGLDVLDGERTGRDVTEPGVHVRVPGHVQVVFDGGSTGAGHAQQNYIDYLASPVAASGPTAAFLAGLTARGYRPGELRAIDISTPQR